MAYLGQDHYFYQTEVKGMDSGILMYLLEESSPVECCDDERLQSFIQSLEAEIDSPIIPSSEGYGSIHDQLNGSASDDELDCSTWIDMGMEMTSSFPPCDDMMMINWYMENGSDHQVDDEMIEFEEIKEYSQICYRVPSEENVESSVLWPHETYEPLFNV